MSQPVCVDASAWVAITNRKDVNHRKAVQIFHRLLGASTRLIATTWTAYEALTIIKSRLGFSQAERLWDRFQAKALVDLVRIDRRLFGDVNVCLVNVGVGAEATTAAFASHAVDKATLTAQITAAKHPASQLNLQIEQGCALRAVRHWRQSCSLVREPEVG